MTKHEQKHMREPLSGVQGGRPLHGKDMKRRHNKTKENAMTGPSKDNGSYRQDEAKLRPTT